MVMGAARRPPSTADRVVLLERAVGLGADVAPGVVGCSLTVQDTHGWTTPHAWHPVSMTLDRAQYESGTGPCIEAATTGTSQELDTIASDGRFLGFAAAAAEHGVRSSLSVPLPQAPQPSALNLYATRPGAFDTVRNREVADLLARLIAVLLGAPGPRAPGVGSTAELARERGASVREAVTLRAAQTSTTTDETYLALAQRTRREGRRMGELAALILGDGDRSPTVSP